MSQESVKKERSHLWVYKKLKRNPLSSRVCNVRAAARASEKKFVKRDPTTRFNFKCHLNNMNEFFDTIFTLRY